MDYEKERVRIIEQLNSIPWYNFIRIYRLKIELQDAIDHVNGTYDCSAIMCDGDCDDCHLHHIPDPITEPVDVDFHWYSSPSKT
jgi:hypothetical protein